MTRDDAGSCTRRKAPIAFFIASFSFTLLFSSKFIDENESSPSTLHSLRPNENIKFHQSGFGGIKNIAHPAGAAARRELSVSDVVIPVSAVPHAIPSLGRENIENLHGHYVHDEHHSPFASFLYDRPKEELEQEQQEYLDKMKKIREEWGAWDFNDEFTEVRPIANFDSTPYKDIKNSDFPKKSWQMDEKYVRSLVAEGRKLIERIRDGIYAEYGYATKDIKTEEESQNRDRLFQIHISETSEGPEDDLGLAWINRRGFSMLARKLLHSMMTNDEFYYVLGGHSAAAGHGNNFHQQYTMAFANIMEPVFHKLGMRLIARNLAMGGLGTTHFSMGQATLYGEKDFLLWDSEMTEKLAEDMDLFNKQALLGGERIPILFGNNPNNLEIETGGNLFFGKIMEGKNVMPLTTGLEQVEDLPWATRYQNCEANVIDLCSGHDKRLKYDAYCWVERSDYEPAKKQLDSAPSQASWHPGNRWHQWKSRQSIMLFLKAFDEAFNIWEDGIEKDGFPLKEHYWHVGEHYQKVRSTLSNYLNNEGFNTTACEKRWGSIPGLDKACRISLHGMTEFTPHNLGEANGILAHVKASSDGYRPKSEFQPEYEGIDILPPSWKVPEGHIDLHAIAIASTYSPPALDHSWAEGDDDDTEEADLARRILRKSKDVVESKPHVRARTNGIQVKTESSFELRLLDVDETNEMDDSGMGWGIEIKAGEEYTGYCDGSPMSTCKRSKDNKCLLSGHNDSRTNLVGNGLSGWLRITIPKVKVGFIFARLEWWHPRGDQWTSPKDITEENNDGRRRHLKASVIPWPDDFELDVALNGEIVKTYSHNEFAEFQKELAYNEAFYPLIDDEHLVPGNEAISVELGLRIRSESNPKDAAFGITHIYYA